MKISTSSIRTYLSKLLSIAVILFFLSPFLGAQATTGSIVGVARDTTGGILPGVEITVTEVNKGSVTYSLTSSEGMYVVSSLLPGTYTLVAEIPGFKKEIVENFILRVKQDARVDFTLQVGEITESVMVEGGVQLVQTEQGSLGEVITEEKVANLPLNKRRVVQLAALTSGAVPPSPGGEGGFTVRATGRDFQTVQIGGGRELSTSFQIDGVEAVSWWLKNMSLQPSVDVIREFKVEKNAASAEFDRAQAVVNVSTKSGTNEFHGSLYWFHRNDNLDARNFFAVTKEEFKQNQWGGTVGGPIVKDKTHFFFGYESFRNHKQSPFLAKVPTSQQLAGDFSGLTDPIFDPLTGGTDPFPGNIIPSNRISDFSNTHGAVIPAANLSGDPNFNYGANVPRNEDTDQIMVRIDHQLSENHSIFGRYLWQTGDLLQPQIAELFSYNIPQDGQNALIQTTSNFGTVLINEFKVSYNRSKIISRIPSTSGGAINYHATMGIKNVLAAAGDPVDFSVPGVNITGTNGGFGHFGWVEGGTDNFYRLSDTATWTKGKHTLKGGLAYEQIRYQTQNNFPNTSFLFDGQLTGNPIADYILGMPVSASGGLGNTRVNLRSHLPEIFISDTWRIKPRLTLNVGIRYHYRTPWVDENDRLVVLDDLTGLYLYPSFPTGEIFPGIADKVWPEDQYPVVRRSIRDPDQNNFSPRLGFAFRPSNDNDTVIRGGYGVFYDSVNGNEFNSLNFGPPFMTLQSIAIDPTDASTHIFMRDMIPDPFQRTPNLLVFTTGRSDKTPYVQQWNLAVQRRLAGDLALELAYSGSAGRKLSGRFDPNAAMRDCPSVAPTPCVEPDVPIQDRRKWDIWGRVYGYWWQSNSNYQAFTARLERSFSAGMSFLANYTYSKSLDLTSKHNGIGNTFDRYGSSYGRSDFDARQRFVYSYVQELPFGAGKHFDLTGVADAVVGGWQLNAIYTAQSGIPFSVGTSKNRGLSRNSRYANRIGDGSLSRGERDPSGWFDTKAFDTVATNRHGNSGRNILDAPGINNVDLGISKDIRFMEQAQLQIRFELFNMFNHAFFSHPTGNVDSGTFGVISRAADARELQFGLKIIF